MFWESFCPMAITVAFAAIAIVATAIIDVVVRLPVCRLYEPHFEAWDVVFH